MTIKLKTKPAKEPLSTAEAIAHLRVDPVINVPAGNKVQGNDFNNFDDPLTVVDAVTRYPIITFVFGKLFQIETEIMEVTAVSGDDVTFDRGIVDTTVAVHTVGITINTATFFNDEVRLLVKAVREKVEQWEWRSLITQTWTLSLDEFPPFDLPIGAPNLSSFDEDVIWVPRPPLQSVTSIKYIDNDGVTQTVATADYVVDSDAEPGRIKPAFGKVWPDPRDEMNAVTVEFVAGYGNDPADVPETSRQVMKLLLGEYFGHRSAIEVASLSEIPLGVCALLNPANNEKVLAFV